MMWITNGSLATPRTARCFCCPPVNNRIAFCSQSATFEGAHRLSELLGSAGRTVFKRGVLCLQDKEPSKL